MHLCFKNPIGDLRDRRSFPSQGRCVKRRYSEEHCHSTLRRNEVCCSPLEVLTRSTHHVQNEW